MRLRLSKDDRRAGILDKARQLIVKQGLANTEMEDIRIACGISRGGLYHHFSNKRAVLDALVEDEVLGLAQIVGQAEGSPITALLHAGSGHLNGTAGVLSGLSSRQERLDYLSSLDQAISRHLSEPLAARLADQVAPGVNPDHLAELFLTVNAHMNRKEILSEWRPDQAAGFAATALSALAQMLRDPEVLDPILAALVATSGQA